MNAVSTPDRASEALLRLARRVESGGFAQGLNPAQWAALRYFARANRFSRTVSAFARFHDTTRGTASQSVRALVGKGLLSRRRDPNDGRAAAVVPSDAGWRLLAQDPVADLESAVGRLSTEHRNGLREALDALWREVAGGSGAGFGRCRNCECLRRDDGTIFCAVAREGLAEPELDLICVSYSSRQTPADGAAPATTVRTTARAAKGGPVAPRSATES